MKVVRGKKNHRTLSMRTNNHVRKKERKAKEILITNDIAVIGVLVGLHPSKAST